MRIAFIVDAFPALTETFVLNQITGLIDRGHNVEIFSGRGSEKNESSPEIAKYDLLAHTYYHNDKPAGKFARIVKALGIFLVNFHKAPLVILRSLDFFRYGGDSLSLSLFYKAILFINAGKFDIIHCHFGTNGNVGALLKELGIKGKLVTMFHGYDIRLGIKKGGGIYKRLFEQGDLFLSISKYNYDNLVAFGADPDKIITHPVGVDIKEIPFKSSKDSLKEANGTVKIVTVARLIEEKGLFYGLKAIKELVEKSPGRNLEYRIIGAGPLKDKLASMAEELGLKETVYFLGAIPHKEVIKALSESDIFFLPSRAEALPVVLMEAQAVGLPVVATSVGSVSDIVADGKSGFIVPGKDTAAMAGKLKHLIDHPECWPQMGRMGWERVEENYDVNKLNDRLVEIYKKLISPEI